MPLHQRAALVLEDRGERTLTVKLEISVVCEEPPLEADLGDEPDLSQSRMVV